MYTSHICCINYGSLYGVANLSHTSFPLTCALQGWCKNNDSNNLKTDSMLIFNMVADVDERCCLCWWWDRGGGGCWWLVVNKRDVKNITSTTCIMNWTSQRNLFNNNIIIVIIIFCFMCHRFCSLSMQETYTSKVFK